MSTDTVQILNGNTFVVSDRSGDIDASPTDTFGLFSLDTRFVSKWILTLNGERLTALSTDDLQYFESQFFLAPSSGTIYVNSKMSIIRRRVVSDGFHEEVTVMNHDDHPVEFELRIDVDADFADLFEVKDNLPKKGAYDKRIENNTLTIGYRRDTYSRQTSIASSADGAVDKEGFTFTAKIGSHDEWKTSLDVVPFVGSSVRAGGESTATSRVERQTTDMVSSLKNWIESAPTLHSSSDSLKITYRRSLVDLAALRFTTLTNPDRALPAAGLPWFMTIFGRDSIFTSLQALPFTSELASTTLLALAERQGTRVDDFREEDPGRILHEMRFGELTAFEERPHSPYFGNADATALFVVLLDEYERWTGDAALVKALEVEARAALNWINEYGDLQNNGYVSYERRNETGLENQCWKDSWDSISYRDGRLAGLPRATCELQGYAYDAKARGARLARKFWNDEAYARKLEDDAADLKRRFNNDFWVEDGGYFAVALETNGDKVDSLTSNIGHLLWSGIVDESKAKSVVDHLMGPALFSGWGVRTLAEGENRYNPIGYHNGTIWPFDNSFIAWGLRKYGYKDEAARIAAGILDAANFFEGRLPEAFGGYERSLTKYPVEYPTACSPQAWSTGAPLLFLRTMLGLEPVDDHLLVDPALPEQIGRVELLDISGRWGKIDAFGRGRVTV